MITKRSFAVGLTAAMAMAALPQCAFAQTGAIRIGMVVSATGPAADDGRFALIGAKLAVDEVNKAGVLGKQVELVTEDDRTTEEGAVQAFQKLAAQEDMVGFLGSIRSVHTHAMAPDILKRAKPVMFGGTNPTLTQMGNPWLFRCRPNDTYSGRVLADYGMNTLGKRKWAIVHSTDAFGTWGSKALADAVTKGGGAVALDQSYANQTQDFTPVVQAVKKSGADILGSYMTFENDIGLFAKQLRQLGVNITYVGSPSIVNVAAAKIAGPALYGTYGVADYAEESSAASQAFGQAFRAVAKAAPDNQSAWTYDAVIILAKAINAA